MLDGQRYELIEGDLIDKAVVNPPHSAFMIVLAKWLGEAFGGDFLRNQMPIDVRPEDNPTNHPQPDLCVTSMRVEENFKREPVPGDIRLIIEVSDTTLAYDLP